jgi:hypothetical protein
VAGPDASPLTDRLVTNAVRALDPGESCYAAITDADGTMLDDTLVYNLPVEWPDDGEYLVIPNAGHDTEMYDRWARHRDEWDLAATVDNATESYAMVALQGRESHDLLAAETDADLADLERFEATVADVAGVTALVARTGYTGDLAFVGYSLGVTGIRWWSHRYHVTEGTEPPMETFVGLSGPNHGTPACDLTCWFTDCRDWSDSIYGITGWLDPGEVCQSIGEDCTDDPGELLYELNTTGGETPADARYYTVRSVEDPLYTTFGCGYNPDSPRLAGAEENFEYGYSDDIDHGDTPRGNNFDACDDCPPEPPELVAEWVGGDS